MRVKTIASKNLRIIQVAVASVLGFGIIGASTFIFTSSIPTTGIAAEKAINGTVSYREHINLPPEASLIVQLVDVSRMDVAAELIAETHITSGLEDTSIAYTMRFNPGKIQDKHRYALQARISAGDTLWFVNDTQHPFDPSDFERNYDIKVINVRNPVNTNLPDTIESNQWLAEDIFNRGVIDFAQTTLAVSSSGEVSGSGGCNQYFTQATITGKAISFGEIGSSFMQCPPALMHQESKFFEVLNQARSYSLDGGKLYLLNEAGNEIARMSGHN